MPKGVRRYDNGGQKPASSNGKGDHRRKGADDAAYREGWDRIFGGKKEEDAPEVPFYTRWYARTGGARKSMLECWCSSCSHGFPCTAVQPPQVF